ncbi:MAG: ester cyclase [Anaerolineales bacterium]
MTHQSTPATNKEMVRSYIEDCLNKGNADLIDTIFAPAMRAKVKAFHADHAGPFDDGIEEIKDLVAEGDKVMARWIFRATHTGEFLGIVPTGKRIEITGYSLYTFENGQIAWDTMSMDWLDGLEQLGATIAGPAASPQPAQALAAEVTELIRVMSFNVNAAMGEGADAWTERAPLSVATIRRCAPDMIGFQEITPANLEVYLPALPNYEHVAGNAYGENPPDGLSSIFWLAARFELLDTGEFWFSDTPDVAAAGWGVPYPMGATWVRLRSRATGAEVVHLNTHYEDGPDGVISRPAASRLIVARLAGMADGVPAIATGDFNCNPWSDAYRIFLAGGFVDTYRAAGHGDSAASSTFHDYKGPAYDALEYGDEVFWRVDWVLSRDGAQRLQTTSCTVVRDGGPATYPSDHYPVVSEMRLFD